MWPTNPLQRVKKEIKRRHLSESSILELKSMVDLARVIEKVNILPELIAA
jgi:hypothetical protein